MACLFLLLRPPESVGCWSVGGQNAFPDRPFHNFGASKSVAWHSWTTYNSQISWFRASKIVKSSVGFSVHLTPKPDRTFCNFETGVICVAQELRAHDFEAPKLWKSRSGTNGNEATADRTIHNFRTRKVVFQWNLCNLKLSISWFWGQKIIKCSVGQPASQPGQAPVVQQKKSEVPIYSLLLVPFFWFWDWSSDLNRSLLLNLFFLSFSLSYLPTTFVRYAHSPMCLYVCTPLIVRNSAAAPYLTGFRDHQSSLYCQTGILSRALKR